MSSELDSLIDEHAPSAAATPASSSKPAPAATPAGTSAPAASSSEWWKTKYKLDREEKDLDLQETFKDEAKRTQFISAYQRGLNADREIARTIKERDEYVLGILKEQGIDYAPDEAARGGLRFTAKQVAAAKAAVAADPDPAAKAAAKEMDLSELEAKAKGGDPEAIVEWTKRENERRFKAWQEEQKKSKEAEEKAKQDGEYQSRLKRYQDYVYSELAKSIEAEKAAFEGLSEDTLKDIFAAAAQRAMTPKGKPQDAVDYVKRRAEELKSVIETRTKQTLETAKPGPKPPPVHGGSPAGSGTNKNKNTSDLDELIEEHVGR